MGKDANELAMRDPAAAALFGVTGSDFGVEPTLYTGSESDFGSDFDGEDEFGVDEFGNDDNYDQGFSTFGGSPWMPSSPVHGFHEDFRQYPVFGYDFGAAPPPGHPAAPAHVVHMKPAPVAPQHKAILMAHAKRQAHREHRAMLLEPNKYSDLKVERYTFSLSATITALGTTGALSGSNSPDVNFRPQRVTANVVSPGMVTFTDLRVANVSFSVGGMLDAWQFNANAVGQHMDVPTLTPANKASFIGSYTGLVPSPLSGTGSYPFILSFTGPSSIVA
jgi:hypothetical protein